MGSWGHGPFDSDSAADWASALRLHYTTVGRTYFLHDTMRALVDAPDTFKLEVYTDYELDSLVEHAVAAVACIADKTTGQCQHTNSPFALGCASNEPYDINPSFELEPVSDALHALALATLDRVEQLLATDPTAAPYRDTLAALRADLVTRAPGIDTAPARKLTGATTTEQEGTNRG